MTTAIYENYAGNLLGYVEQVGTDAYLDAGLSNFRNVIADQHTIAAFTNDKIAAANYEASLPYEMIRFPRHTVFPMNPGTLAERD